MRKKVSIYGGSGYAGAELLRILGGHDGVDVVDVFGGSSAGSSIAGVLSLPDCPPSKPAMFH